MREKKARKSNSIIFTITREIDAPLDYVYKWCTDFDEEDTKITGSSSCRIMIEKTSKRAIYAMINGTKGNSRGRMYLVKLEPPNSWHMNAYGNGSDSTGDYNLAKISKNRTKLTVTFDHIYYDITVMPAESKKKLDSQNTWNKYVSALEKDFRNSILAI